MLLKGIDSIATAVITADGVPLSVFSFQQVSTEELGYKNGSIVHCCHTVGIWHLRRVVNRDRNFPVQSDSINSAKLGDVLRFLAVKRPELALGIHHSVAVSHFSDKDAFATWFDHDVIQKYGSLWECIRARKDRLFALGVDCPYRIEVSGDQALVDEYDSFRIIESFGESGDFFAVDHGDAAIAIPFDAGFSHQGHIEFPVKPVDRAFRLETDVEAAKFCFFRECRIPQKGNEEAGWKDSRIHGFERK